MGANSKLLFVNFHHLRAANDPRFPHLHHRSIADFRAQIAILRKRFAFPHPDEVRAAILADRALAADSCVLTFDDGLRDHHDIVAPVLSEFGIHGVFSINTGPWESGRLLSVHMAHLLSAAFSYTELASDFEAAAARIGCAARLADVDPKKTAGQYRYDDAATARVKYYINAVIPQELRPLVMAEVFRARLGDEAEFVEMHYLTMDMARSLREAGHVIGLHSHTHLHLASATPSVRRSDLSAGIEWLQRALGRDYRSEWISYPYGSPSAINAEVVADAEALGCDIGLSMTRGSNCLPGAERMLLRRVDTNDVEGGKRAIDWSELMS